MGSKWVQNISFQPLQNKDKEMIMFSYKNLYMHKTLDITNPLTI